MNDFWCWGIVILIVAVLFIMVKNNADKMARVNTARAAYQKELQKLRDTPFDTKQRERVLSAGREYIEAAIAAGKSTIFTEVTMLNDLTAITGESLAQNAKDSAVNAPDPKPENDIASRLKKLENLREQQLITEDEYEKRRSAILDQL
jgi:hypothetical protein